MKKPFALFPINKPKSSTSKRMRASMYRQRTECEWYQPSTQVSPEAALGLAVLQRAVMDLITPGVIQKDRQSAYEWIVGAWGDEHEKEYPYSFSRIVESFSNIGIEEFREKILKFSEDAREQEALADGFRFQRGQ